MTSTTERQGREWGGKFRGSLSGEVALKQRPERVSEAGRQQVPVTTVTTWQMHTRYGLRISHKLTSPQTVPHSAPWDPHSRK